MCLAAECCVAVLPTPKIRSAVVPITVFLWMWLLGVLDSSKVDLDGVKTEPVIITFGVMPMAEAALY